MFTRRSEPNGAAAGTAAPRMSLFRKLRVWRRHHLAPAAPWYLACTLPGATLLLVSLYGAQFHIPGLPLAKLAVAGLCLLVTPFVISSAIALFSPVRNGSSFFGFFISYHLTERQLVYTLCRIIPVFQVALDEIRWIQPWRGVGPASYASNENNLYWFWVLKIWFWPRPVRQWLKILFSVQAIRCEYALTCNSGWVIVLSCSHAFAEQVNRQVQRLKPPAAQDEPPRITRVIAEPAAPGGQD